LASTARGSGACAGTSSRSGPALSPTRSGHCSSLLLSEAREPVRPHRASNSIGSQSADGLAVAGTVAPVAAADLVLGMVGMTEAIDAIVMSRLTAKGRNAAWRTPTLSCLPRYAMTPSSHCTPEASAAKAAKIVAEMATPNDAPSDEAI